MRFYNEFHDFEAVAVATLVRQDGNRWVIELSPATRRRLEKKLCPWSECRCKKIDSATAVASRQALLLEY